MKDKEREHNKPDRVESYALMPEVEAKLSAQGLDPETFTLKELFHEVLDADGSDLTLISATEFEVLKTYRKTRKYLAETYPQPQQLSTKPKPSSLPDMTTFKKNRESCCTGDRRDFPNMLTEDT